MRLKIVVGRVRDHVVFVRPEMGRSAKTLWATSPTPYTPRLLDGQRARDSSRPSSDGLVTEDQLTCGAFESSYGCDRLHRGIASSHTGRGRRRRASYPGTLSENKTLRIPCGASASAGADAAASRRQSPASR